MKKISIKKFTHAEVDAPKETFGFLKIPIRHTLIRAEGEELEVSDGYHTMDELYEHRIELYIALCASIRLHTDKEVWKSKQHHDGSKFEGWFILGIGSKQGEQISYHLPIDKWDDANFAVKLEKAPEWDGHTPADVLRRLKLL